MFHGKRGELRQRYREGQEDQLGALGLVVNVIVLWNTIYLDAALNRLRAEGFHVRDEDVARLFSMLWRALLNWLSDLVGTEVAISLFKYPTGGLEGVKSSKAIKPYAPLLAHSASLTV